LPDTAAPPASAVADRASQTLHRALDILEAVAEGAHSLKAFEERVGLTRSTTHRLASALVDRGLLSAVGRDYRLGGRLVQLGHQAGERLGLADVARPVLAALSAETQDATNLGAMAGDEVLYVAQVQGRRRLEIRHRVGDRNLIRDTALGRALLIDSPPERWAALFSDNPKAPEAAAFQRDMTAARGTGHALHLEDGGDSIRCIAAPIRDASGAIVAAISLSSVPQYMDEARMAELTPQVVAAALEIGLALGFNPARLSPEARA
jgi:DNA-binding IclR family transcriptional regulator